MGRKLRTEQYGVFPSAPKQFESHFVERDAVVGREFARRAGLPDPEKRPFENLGNRELPVFLKKAEIQKNLRDDRISIVEGETGSGKSTQLAQYALEMGYTKVIYLEPHRLPADNVSDRLVSELNEQLGGGVGDDLVGVRHSERSTGRGKRIEVMTPGTFMRILSELKPLEDEPVLIVGDEIHEKDFPTELGVARAVKMLEDRPKWRVALMSATLDPTAIHDVYDSINGRPIPMTSVEGRPHELEVIEEPDLTAEEAYDKYGVNHKKTLIFTAGKEEIRDTINNIHKKQKGVRLDPLHAKLPHYDIYRATNADIADGYRQAIVSTSAAETGITIPGLTLVITDGTVRRPDLDEDAVPGLFKQQCAQDELTQQGGRAGRDIGGGVVVYVKPDDDAFPYIPFEERDAQAPAQIYQMNIAGSVLLAESFEAGVDFYQLNKLLLHKVDTRRILEAYDVLYRLQAVDDHNRITPIGESMVRFPVRPEFGRVLTEALKRHASAEAMQHLAGVVSAVEAGGLAYFERGIGDKWREDVREDTKDDYLAQLDMFYATRRLYDGTDVNERELEQRNYDIPNTRQAHKTFDKIARVLGIQSYDLDITPPTPDQVRELYGYLTAGLFDFAHRRVSDGDDKWYVSLHDSHGQAHRELSSRHTYKADDPLVIGMPRRFEKKEKGDLVKHSTIENVMPVTRQMLGRYVAHLLVRRPVADSKMMGGYLERTDDLVFGTLHISTEPSISRFTHTPETRQQLAEAAYSKPTHTLSELVAIKKHLENIVRLVPDDEIDTYFPQGILTGEWLHATVEGAVDDTVDSIYGLDNNLRTIVVRGNVSVETWLDPAIEREIRHRSPETVALESGVEYQLYYSHGKPFINGFNLRDADQLPENLYLADGREVKIHYRIGADTKAYSSGTIREYALSLD